LANSTERLTDMLGSGGSKVMKFLSNPATSASAGGLIGALLSNLTKDKVYGSMSPREKRKIERANRLRMLMLSMLGAAGGYGYNKYVSKS
jgi:hypothetical protein